MEITYASTTGNWRMFRNMSSTEGKISYRNNIRPDIKLIAELYKKAQLNRPVENLDRLQTMYDNSNIVLSAWDDDILAGILRGWTDEAFHGYVCDLAVHPDYQQCGIGKELLDQAKSINFKVELVLRASAIARDYYQHIGWKKIENGWFSSRES